MDKFNFNNEKALIYKIIAGLACLTLILCLFSCSDKKVKETLNGEVTVITEDSTGLGETETLQVEVDILEVKADALQTKVDTVHTLEVKVLEPVIESITEPLPLSDTTQVIQ